MNSQTDMTLKTGSQIAVLGGGPAGTFFSYYLLDMAERIGIEINIDIYEPRDYSKTGPVGCNMCGGVVSEAMIQTLAMDGINLPNNVVRRGVDSYVLSLDVGKVKIVTPALEKRIAAVHRGAGPRGSLELDSKSFDGHLLELAVRKGARHIPRRVEKVCLQDGRPEIHSRNEPAKLYDLLVISAGVNTAVLKAIEDLGTGYRAPSLTKTYICELQIGREKIQQYLGSSIFLFLPNIPRIDVACIVPKGDFATLCLLGDNIDDALVKKFLDSPEVKSCLPPDWRLKEDECHCAPKMNVGAARKPFADRIVAIGDSGVTRLNKDGIGAAYRTAKVAATTVAFHGVSEQDFRKHYLPLCRTIITDNAYGRVLFTVVHQLQRMRFLRRGVLRTVVREQTTGAKERPMSMVFWDTFTGNAPYKDVFMRAIRPKTLIRVISDIVIELFSFSRNKT